MNKIKEQKNKIIIFLIIVIVILMGLVSYLLISEYKEKIDDLYSSCYDLEKGFGGPIDITMKDCVGYLRLEQSKLCGIKEQPKNCENIYVYDALHNLSFIRNVDKYLINKENNLYVVGELWATNFKDENGEEFVIRIPVNGEYQVIDYKSKEEMPRYFLINSETGDMTLYNTYDQMPDEVKNIFKSLEQ
jgi:hypothetical protein